MRRAISTMTCDPYPPKRTNPVESFGSECPSSAFLHPAVSANGFIEAGVGGSCPKPVRRDLRPHPPRNGLLHRPLRSADEVLILGLKPEVRRIVGQIRHQGHEWRAWRFELQARHRARD